MSEIAFDRETLKRYCDPKGQRGPTVRHVAAYALTLLDRAERAERGLREAEEAIQKAREYVRTAIARRQPGYIADEYANEFLRAYNKLPAVRRALDRKGEV